MLKVIPCCQGGEPTAASNKKSIQCKYVNNVSNNVQSVVFFYFALSCDRSVVARELYLTCNM